MTTNVTHNKVGTSIYISAAQVIYTKLFIRNVVSVMNVLKSK